MTSVSQLDDEDTTSMYTDATTTSSSSYASIQASGGRAENPVTPRQQPRQQPHQHPLSTASTFERNDDDDDEDDEDDDVNNNEKRKMSGGVDDRRRRQHRRRGNNNNRNSNNNNNRDAKQHPWRLNYLDPASEARYLNFCFSSNEKHPWRIIAYLATNAFLGIVMLYRGADAVQTITQSSYRFVYLVLALVWIGIQVATAVAVRYYTRRQTGLFHASKRLEDIIVANICLSSPIFFVFTFIPDYPRYSAAHLINYFNIAVLFSNARFSRLLVVAPYLLIMHFAVGFIPLGNMDHTTQSYWNRLGWGAVAFYPLLVAPLLCLHYLERIRRHAFEAFDTADLEMERIEGNTAWMHQLLVDFYPPTPTFELLLHTAVDCDTMRAYTSCGGYRPAKIYPATAVIASDSVGLTSRATIMEPKSVLEVIRTIFDAIEALATTHEVEKIATIGDTFLGVVFPTTTSGEDSKDVARRCGLAIAFASQVAQISVPFHPNIVRQRVGVDVGDVIGGFVGCSPPRFDVIGAAVNRAHELEGKGEVGYAHVSWEAYTRASRVGKAVDAGSRSTSPQPGGGGAPTRVDSVLVSRWLSFEVGGGVNIDKMSYTSQLKHQKHAAGRRGRRRQQRSNDDDKTLITRRLLALAGHHERTMSIGAADDDDDVASPSFSYGSKIFLHFRDSRLEHDFYNTFLANAPGQRDGADVRAIVIAFLGVLYVSTMHMVLGCRRSVLDRWVISLFHIFTGAIILALQWLYPARLGQTAMLRIVACTLSVPLMLCGLIYAECDGEGSNHLARTSDVSSIIFLYTSTYTFSAVMFLRTKMQNKMAFITLSVVISALQVLVRPFVRDDEIYAFDPLATACYILYFAPYVLELDLRDAFVAHQSIRYARTHTGQHTVRMRRAFETMLPAFAAERFTSVITQHQKRLLLEPSTTATSTNDNMELIGDDVLSSMLWEETHVAIVFVQFKKDTSQGQPETIELDAVTSLDDAIVEEMHRRNTMVSSQSQNEAASLLQLHSPTVPTASSQLRHFTSMQSKIEEIEDIASELGLVKINSVGSTVLFVYGLSHTVTGVEAVNTAVSATWSIVERALLPNPELAFRASVHSGACFGTLIRPPSLMSFDVFGFAVSMAHRLLDSAPLNSVHLSVSALERLGESGVPEGAMLVTCPIMEVRGVGVMSTYALVPGMRN
eukprot:PhM_4_TR14804/c0_g1_i1/m.89285